MIQKQNDLMYDKGFEFIEFKLDSGKIGSVFVNNELKIICIVYPNDCFELVYTNKKMFGIYESGVIEGMTEGNTFDITLEAFMYVVDGLKLMFN